MAVYGTWWYWVLFFLTYIAWWALPLILIFVYRKMLDKYPIDIVIYEKRGENIIKTDDVAGRFTNPVTCYKLKKSKDTIPVPQYDWVLQCMHKPTNLFEKIPNLISGKIGSLTLFKYGSKQYKPVKVRVNDGTVRIKFKEVKDVNGQPIWINVYELINPKRAMSKLDFEVIDWDDMNHMTQELRAIALRRSPVMKFFEKYGVAIIIILSIMALIFSGYFYKEIMTDAGNKYVALVNAKGTVNPVVTEPIKSANVPIIGNLMQPSGT
jgi:hypothetical protein